MNIFKFFSSFLVAVVFALSASMAQAEEEQNACTDDLQAQFNECLFQCLQEFPECQEDAEEVIGEILKEIAEECEDSEGTVQRRRVRKYKRFARLGRRLGLVSRSDAGQVNKDLNECKSGEEEEEEEEEEAESVVVCHIPPGNPAERHTIKVGAPAVSAHLRHGDILGECPDEETPEEEEEEEKEEEGSEEESIK